MKVLVDDLVERGYFGVILTGGEPTLHDGLPEITAYARDQGLHVRMITNGHRLADEDFARRLAEAGLQHVHVSVYSHKPEVEEQLRGMPKTLGRAFRAVDNANRFGITVNINCVINRLNCDHLHETIAYWIENHPHVRHFIWNNLDPSMGRAEVNQGQFLHRLGDFEWSLHEACRLLDESGRTFRVEKVPLCYMTDYAWASTETRKIVKGEERIVHFLDDKQTVRQTDWGHLYAEACRACSLQEICGGLFDRGNGYDPDELSPVFVSRDRIVERIIQDPADPSYKLRSLAAWNRDFERRVDEARREAEAGAGDRDGSSVEEVREGVAGQPMSVGQVTTDSLRLFERKRRIESKQAERKGFTIETDKVTRQAVDRGADDASPTA
jgi:MoaA/NifB/PqqE/SkfB family radical SAM enzyme